MHRTGIRAAVTGLALASTLGLGVGTASADDSTFTIVGQQSSNGGYSSAQCPEGSHLIGGGYTATPAFTNGGSPADFVDVNGPSPSQSRTWIAKLHVGRVAAHALCQQDN